MCVIKKIEILFRVMMEYRYQAKTNERTNEMESSVKMMSPSARAAALKREKKSVAAAARIAGKVAAAERRAADEAAWTEGVRKIREAIEKKIAALRKAMGVRKNEPNSSAICAMKERMEFEMMYVLRKEIYGESFVLL